MAHQGAGDKTQKGLRALIRFVRFCERISRRRLAALLTSRPGQSVLGVVITVFIVGAALAPPFSGLDTLPSIGVVLVALAILLEDAAFALVGVVLGVLGIVLTIFLGAEAADYVGGLLH